MQTKPGHDWKINFLTASVKLCLLENDARIFLMTRKRHDVGLGEVREEVGAGLRHHSGRNACNAPSTE